MYTSICKLTSGGVIQGQTTEVWVWGHTQSIHIQAEKGVSLQLFHEHSKMR